MADFTDDDDHDDVDGPNNETMTSHRRAGAVKNFFFGQPLVGVGAN